MYGDIGDNFDWRVFEERQGHSANASALHLVMHLVTIRLAWAIHDSLHVPSIFQGQILKDGNVMSYKQIRILTRTKIYDIIYICYYFNRHSLLS